MCARASGALSLLAPPRMRGASKSSVAVSPSPDSGNPEERESTAAALAGGVDRSSFKACCKPAGSAKKAESLSGFGGVGMVKN